MFAPSPLLTRLAGEPGAGPASRQSGAVGQPFHPKEEGWNWPEAQVRHSTVVPAWGIPRRQQVWRWSWGLGWGHVGARAVSQPV